MKKISIIPILLVVFLTGFILAGTITPSTNTLITSSTTQTFTGTFTNNATSCSYAIGLGGTSTSSVETKEGSITPSGATCTFTKSFNTSADNGNWYWYINSVNETVVNETNAWLNATGYTLSTSTVTGASGWTLTAIWGAQSGAYNVSIPLANASVSAVGVVTNATTVTNSNVSYSYVYNDAPGTNVLQVQLPSSASGLPAGYKVTTNNNGGLSVVPAGLGSVSPLVWVVIAFVVLIILFIILNRRK